MLVVRASTRTVSAAEPSRKVKSSVVVWFTASSKSASVAVAKPSLPTVSRYLPGIMFTRT